MSDSTDSAGSAAGSSLTIHDNRTGKDYEVPIVDGTVRGSDLAKIRAGEDGVPLAVYDPGFVNTASCRSSTAYRS